MNKDNEIIWQLPARIDDSGTENMWRYIDDIKNLEVSSALVLDLTNCRSFDFTGARLLLELITTARKKQAAIAIKTDNRKIFSLLHFMQFDLLVAIYMGET